MSRNTTETHREGKPGNCWPSCTWKCYQECYILEGELVLQVPLAYDKKEQEEKMKNYFLN